MVLRTASIAARNASSLRLPAFSPCRTPPSAHSSRLVYLPLTRHHRRTLRGSECPASPALPRRLPLAARRIAGREHRSRAEASAQDFPRFQQSAIPAAFRSEASTRQERNES